MLAHLGLVLTKILVLTKTVEFNECIMRVMIIVLH